MKTDELLSHFQTSSNRSTFASLFQGGCEFVPQQRPSSSSPNNRRDPARAQHVDIPHRHQCKSGQR